jgi:dienelactone hydrolase
MTNFVPGFSPRLNSVTSGSGRSPLSWSGSAIAWLFALTFAGEPALSAQEVAVEVSVVEETTREAHTGRTGEYTTSVTITDLLGESTAQLYVPILPIDEPVEWEVYVPESYDPAVPAGLLVYISPMDNGGIPDNWKPLMSKKNLIWIAANHSGNQVAAGRRMVHAVLATAVINRNYRLDGKRVFISGFSGGGRVSSMVATEYPHIFRGAIYNCGADFWDTESPKQMKRILRNRYVFITGSKDFNRRDTRRVFRKYEKAGVVQIKLMVIKGMGHRNPDADDYASAIAYLDGEVE